ncbi:DMT family transporter [Caloranaerobacter ferrireducens]|uniref:DMT family transporter n=1 Tax=Caloranaerobacter ferrireducens TaxID=1323370 RepID=UPI00084D3109|nr:DMT family transporter [Caloranaerobacter ferrireducens]
MLLSYIALLGRVLLLSLERIVVRLLGNNQKNIYSNVSATFLFFFIGALSLLPFSLFININDFDFLIPCYISSILYTIGAVAYVTSLSVGEVSLVTPINSLNSLFLMILSFVFLNEQITIEKFIGIVIIVTGLSILKKEGNPLKSLKYIINNKACRLMFLYVFLQSMGRILDKYFYVTVHPVTYATILYFFISINLLIFLLITKKTKYISDVFNAKRGISIISGCINGFSYLFLLVALKNIELSIAEPITQVSMILTLIFTYIFFKENIKEKIPGSILILIGGWILLTNMN